MKIVADKNIPFLEEALAPYSDLQLLTGSKITSDDIHNADALLVRTRTMCDERLLSGSAIKFIGSATIGYDHIDTDYCHRACIRWTNAAGCNARGVLQYVFTALRQMIERPEGMTLGVVGVGNVGSLVAEVGRNLGMNVLCCDPPRMAADPSLGYITLDELLPQADIVTLHVPLDGTTIGMADGRFFDTMKHGAYFINSSRGEVVDEQSLLAAAGRLSAYVLDVWPSEPNINRQLLAGARIATPHIAGYSLQGKANGTSMIINSLAEYFGLPLKGWYPSEVRRTIPRPGIRWEEITGYDIMADDAALRSHPEDFEALRNNYNYREEYF